MNTNLIPTKQHSYIDYLTAGSLLTMPLMFGRKGRGMETYLPMMMGAGVLVQSLLTDYGSEKKKRKSMGMGMKSHLKMDYANGALMALSPFLFGFRKRSWFPHFAIGLSELAITYFSQSKPKKKKWFGLPGKK